MAPNEIAGLIMQLAVFVFGAGLVVMQVRTLNKAVDELERNVLELMRQVARLDRRVVRLEERVPGRRHADENNGP